MQYQYARIQSIFRKGGAQVEELRANPPDLILNSEAERSLALQLLRFSEALAQAAAEYKPHLIPGYLWDLSKCYGIFYQNCRVLQAESPELRSSRLLLCDLTARTIRLGLHLLGIQTAERM